IKLLGITFSDKIIWFMATDFDSDTHNLAMNLSSIMFPMIICTGLAFSFVGILQSFGEYNIPAIMSLVSNLAVILYFAVFGKKFGVYGLAVTMVIAWGLQALIQVPSLIKFGFKFRPSVNFKDENVKSAMKLALPMLVSTWVQPLYTIVNTRLASGIERGVSSLEYANRLYIVVTGVFSFVITNFIFPKMSRAYVSGDKEKSKEMLVTSIKAVTLIILPIMAVTAVLAKPIVALLYQRGDFIYRDTLHTAGALSCYAFGMIALSYNEILSKSFFSMQNSKTPMINAIISMLANIVTAYLLSEKMGIAGLAIAAAVGSYVNAILNYIFMKRYYGKLFEKNDLLTLIKSLIAAAAMSLLTLFIYRFMPLTESSTIKNVIIILAITVTSGFLVYALICYLLRIDIIVNLLKKESETDE
ncbi:MAG: murein biosynthesis integral membrane protein MurJ, partial [Clostridia bacterium]|nr:murein biosynthesis integral membrane protein MurJ [Clostridia bacterium]